MKGILGEGTKYCESCGVDLVGLTMQHKTCSICVPKGSWYLDKWRKYRLTFEDYFLLLKKQEGFCAMPGCNRYPEYVDHDHKCCFGDKSCGKCVRGILCPGCNTGMHYYDKEGWINNAKEYISARH